MSFKAKYLSDLKIINEHLKSKKVFDDGGALELFKIHIKEVKLIKSFNSEVWNIDWRTCVYDFGDNFSAISPIEFINAINEEKDKSEKNEIEVLDFYLLMIFCKNLLDTKSLNEVDKFLTQYPFNPEFNYIKGALLINLKKYEEGITQIKQAFTWEKARFRNILFDNYNKFFEHLIEIEKYEYGIKVCDEIIKEKLFPITILDSTNHMMIVSFKNRFKDYLTLNKKIIDAEMKIESFLTNETRKYQFRTIEIIGFFTAIVTFILSTVAIGTNFKFEEALIFNISLGIILLLFALVINLIFSTKEIKLLDFRILILIVLLGSLLLIVTKFGIPFWLN